jgi:hypothetical protein
MGWVKEKTYHLSWCKLGLLVAEMRDGFVCVIFVIILRALLLVLYTLNNLILARKDKSVQK